MCLPKLDEVVVNEVIVEEAEDSAPIGHTIIPENASNPGLEPNEQEEEEEELTTED